MLSRGNTAAAKRLRQAKSTSAVGARRKTERSVAFDNREGTYHWALTAANRAFENATLDRSSQYPPFQEISRSNKFHAQKSSDRLRPMKSQPGSFRYSKASPSRASRHSACSKRPVSADRFTPMSQKATNISSRPSSSLRTIFTPYEDDLDFASRFDGYGIPAPPYRRKIGSSCTCRVDPTGSDSLSFDPPSWQSTASARNLSAKLSAVREYQTDEAIIALARDRYLQEYRQEPLQKRHSFLSNSLRARLRRSERFSWQPSSSNSQDRTITPPNQDVPESNIVQGSHHLIVAVKPRKHTTMISTLRGRFRRIFGRSTSNKLEIPSQQIHSTYPHYRQSLQFTPEYNELQVDIPPSVGAAYNDSSIEDRPPTPPPHLEGVEGVERLPRPNFNWFKSPTGDIRSQEERSRVTSWDDSTREPTLALNDIENLPVIKEDREASREVFSIVSEQEHLQHGLRKTSSRFSFKEAIDGRRLVSALLKHTWKGSKRERNASQLLADNKPTPLSDPQINESTSSQVGDLEVSEGDFNISSNVREIPRDLLGPSTSHDEQCEGSVQEVLSFDRDLMSPSIYSSHRESEEIVCSHSSPLKQPSEHIGTATVTASEAVTRWPIGTHQSQNTQSTSNEWRLWAADTFSGLDAIEKLTFSHFGPQIQYEKDESSQRSISQIQRQNFTSLDMGCTPKPSTGPSSMAPLVDIAEGDLGSSRVPSRIQGQHANRQQSGMNERFPKLISGRTASKSSLVSSWRIYSPVINQDEEIPVQSLDLEKIPDLPKTGLTDSATKSTDMRDGGELDAVPEKKPSRIPRLSPVPQTARFKTQEASFGRYPTLANRQTNNLDENFLLKIRKGPYNDSLSSLPKVNNDSVDSIHIPKRRSPGMSTQSHENSPPSAGRRMADEFLKSRSNKKSQDVDTDDESSSLAFL